MEQLLRAFILKISVCDAVLDHNPPGVLTLHLLLSVSMATLGWSVFSSPYLTAPSLVSSFLAFRIPLRVHLLQEASLIDPGFISLLTVSCLST